jgi:hypothetical protein
MERVVTAGGDVVITSTYEEIAERAEAARAALIGGGFKLHRDSELSRLLQVARRMASDFAQGVAPEDKRAYLLLSHCDRVATALLEAVTDPAARELIKRMCSNTLDLSSAHRSTAKDALWELELAAQLRRNSIVVSFGEPDLLAELGGPPYPIACKKPYTLGAAKARLSSGVHQLDATQLGGLVAVNIDALCPPNAALVSPDPRSAGEHLASLNRRFIDHVHPHMDQYVSSGRCDGLYVCTTVVCDLTLTEHRLSTFRQVTLWTLAPPHGAFRPAFWTLAERLSAERSSSSRLSVGEY